MRKPFEHSLFLLILLSLWISAYYQPAKTACAIRALNPFLTFPVWCQAQEWPKP